MKHLLSAVLAFALATGAALAQAAPGNGQNVPAAPPSLTTIGSNGASYPVACDTTVALNITTATTTQPIAPVAGKRIYICNLYASIAGTTPTVQFEWGTGATCGTSTVLISGAFALAAGSVFDIGNNNGSEFFSPLGSGFCIITTGTTPSFQGYISYAVF
jgi:Flp pilus assembly protein TadG